MHLENRSNNFGAGQKLVVVSFERFAACRISKLFACRYDARLYHLPFNILERSVQRIEKILKTCEQNELNIIHQTPQLKVEILDMLRFGFNSVQGIFNAYKLAAIKGHTTPDALRSTKAIHNAATDISAL